MTLIATGRNRVQVGIRIRGTTDEQRRQKLKKALFCDDYDPGLLKVIPQCVSNFCEKDFTREMHFDVCLGPAASQDDVIVSMGVYQMSNAVLSGHNACILAYGPTGCGKTYTMTGPEKTRDESREGLVQKVAKYLLDTICAGDSNTAVSVTYVEVYNEAAYDLLSSQKRRLPVRSRGEAFCVDGARTTKCRNLESIRQIIEQGRALCRVSSTAQNGRSSRSHTILTLSVPTYSHHSTNESHSGHQESNGSFMLVDLAGSERLKDSSPSRKETATINKSLFCLGQVVTALAEGESHVPYRDSVLTKLLTKGLGGNALTLLIACCAESDVHLEETMTTLTYAQKARGIRPAPISADASRMEDGQNNEFSELCSEVEELKEQNLQLRRKLKGINTSAVASLCCIDDQDPCLFNSEYETACALNDIGDVTAEISILKQKICRLKDRLHESPLTAASREWCASRYLLEDGLNNWHHNSLIESSYTSQRNAADADFSDGIIRLNGEFLDLNGI